MQALSLVSIIGAGSIGGRFALGALADKQGRKRCLVGCCCGVGAATLGWAAIESLPGLRTFAFVFGVSYGGFVALLPAVTVDLFGRPLAGKAVGFLYTGRGLAVLIGERTHGVRVSESGALAGCAAIGLIGSVIMQQVRRIKS